MLVITGYKSFAYLFPTICSYRYILKVRIARRKATGAGRSLIVGRVNVIAGPAPRPLDLMLMEVDSSGNVTVNTGKITTRSDFKPTQATKLA